MTPISNNPANDAKTRPIPKAEQLNALEAWVKDEETVGAKNSE
jgi:hypothetical protein